MTAAGTGAGWDALRDAARLEAARVYGGIVREHKSQPSGLAALVAEVDLADLGTTVDEPVDEPTVDRNNRGGRP